MKKMKKKVYDFLLLFMHAIVFSYTFPYSLGQNDLIYHIWCNKYVNQSKLREKVSSPIFTDMV